MLQNLEGCKLGLINWDRTEFGSVMKKVRELKFELEKLQKQPFTAAVKENTRKIKLELEGVLDREEILWKQRAKMQWLAEGDRNTRFFHNKASHRTRVNEISGLFNDAGQWCDAAVSMGNTVTDYFRGIFKSRNPSP